MGIYPCQPYAKKKDFSVHYKVFLQRHNVVAVLVSSLLHFFSVDRLVGLGDLNTTCFGPAIVTQLSRNT